MLTGKLALVTGSTSGIGLGMARALAAEGANIVLNGFGDPAEIEKLRADIESQFKVKAQFEAADLSKTAEVENLIGRVVEQHGAIDILVNNAGIQYVAPIENFPPE